MSATAGPDVDSSLRERRGLAIALAVALVAPVAGTRATTPAAQDATSQFVITLRGVRVGTERVTVKRQAGGVTIDMIGSIGPPIDLVTTRYELTYTPDWQPRQLSVEGAWRNETISIGTTFGLTTATSDVTQGMKRGRVTHAVSPRTIVVTPNLFGGYEALAARITTFAIGASVPVFVVPEGETTATINGVTPRRMSSPEGVKDLREYDLTLNRPGAPLAVLMAIDEAGRLARVVYRDSSLAAIREEFASVMAREIRVPHPGDEDAFIPSTGFNLGATVTRPSGGVSGRLPAVVLVGSAGRQDREESRYGVPIFGHLAGQLADRGYLAVRFDRRGVGQSGGRTEHAGLTEYADDVLAVVEWLRRRRDVDAGRIAVVTHGEGSAVGLIAAARSSRIRGLVLLAATGLTGHEAVLDEQQRALARRNESEADKAAKLALQRRLIDAVLSGRGWDALPPDLRRQADTTWFRSWLLFDPAAVMRRVNQPLLILTGSLDQEAPVAQAERLAALGTARRVPATHTERRVLPGLNHLLVPAGTGDPDEYDDVADRPVSPDVAAAIDAWLRGVLK